MIWGQKNDPQTFQKELKKDTFETHVMLCYAMFCHAMLCDVMEVQLYDLLDVLDLVHELHLCHPPDVLELPDRPDRPDHTQQKQQQQKQQHSLRQQRGTRAKGAPPLFVSVPVVVSVVLFDQNLDQVSAVYDQVSQVLPVQQVDDIDEVHQLDPVHQVDQQDECSKNDIGRFWVDIGCFFVDFGLFPSLLLVLRRSRIGSNFDRIGLPLEC